MDSGGSEPPLRVIKHSNRSVFKRRSDFGIGEGRNHCIADAVQRYSQAEKFCVA